MAELRGTNVSAIICPFTDEDFYPVTDSKYGKGGWREVETVGDLDLITDARLTVGMAVYVTSTSKLYIYKGIEVRREDSIETNPETGEETPVYTETEVRIWQEFKPSADDIAWGKISGTLADQTDLQDALDDKQDNLTSDNAGDNITITTDESGNVTISATDTTYTAGDNISISDNNEISVTDLSASDISYTNTEDPDVQTVENAIDVLFEDRISFDYKTTTPVGGLPKDTDITDWTLSQVMKQMLAPTAVTEPTLSLTNKASTSGVAGSTHTFTAGTVVAEISWTAGTSTNPGSYTLTGTDKDKFEIDGTDVKLKAAETMTAGTSSALTFGVSRTYDIVNSLGKKVSKTASNTDGSLSYSATYPSYVGTTTDTADTFIAATTSAISLPSTFTQKATKNSAYTSYTIPDKNMLTYTNRLVIINKGTYTKIKDASGDITGNFKIQSKSLNLDGTATATYTVAVLINPSAGYKDTLTIS